MRMPCNASGAASADADPLRVGENQGVTEVELEGVAIDEDVPVRCSAGEQACLEECPEKASSFRGTAVLESVFQLEFGSRSRKGVLLLDFEGAALFADFDLLLREKLDVRTFVVSLDLVVKGTCKNPFAVRKELVELGGLQFCVRENEVKETDCRFSVVAPGTQQVVFGILGVQDS